MDIKKGKYYRFDGPNGFTVKALDNSYDATFRAVVVLQGDYLHEVGHISSAWSNTSFVESDLSEFLEEANKRYPMDSRYVSLGGDPEGVKGVGVSSVEYEAKIWYYNDELRGIDMGNYVVYNFCVDKWAEIINDQVDTEETLIEAEFDLTTDEGRLVYAKKYYPIGTKYIPLDCDGNLFNNRYISQYDAKFWEGGSSIEVGNGLIYHHDGKWAEIIKKETNMGTQKLSRKGLKEIHSVACSTWKTNLENYSKRNTLEDYIELTNIEVNHIFNSCTKEQLPIVSKYLKQDDGSVDVTNVNINIRVGGEYEDKAFALHEDYNW